MPNNPEHREQAAFVQWLEFKGYKHTAIPNSTYTRSWNQKRKNKEAGLKPGFPDLVVIVQNRLVAIEMKIKPNKPTKEQKAWIEALNACEGISAFVCYSTEEAIAEIEGMVK